MSNKPLAIPSPRAWEPEHDPDWAMQRQQDGMADVQDIVQAAEDVDLAHANNGGACPDCGGPVEHEGGCCVCRVCGFSECA